MRTKRGWIVSHVFLSQPTKRSRFPVSIINQEVWIYHQFRNSYMDIQEQLDFRGIILSHKKIREWCLKFFHHFRDFIKKREGKTSDK